MAESVSSVMFGPCCSHTPAGRIARRTVVAASIPLRQ
jgi:hypothetical protein